MSATTLRAWSSRSRGRRQVMQIHPLPFCLFSDPFCFFKCPSTIITLSAEAGCHQLRSSYFTSWTLL